MKGELETVDEEILTPDKGDESVVRQNLPDTKLEADEEGNQKKTKAHAYE